MTADAELGELTAVVLCVAAAADVCCGELEVTACDEIELEVVAGTLVEAAVLVAAVVGLAAAPGLAAAS